MTIPLPEVLAVYIEAKKQENKAKAMADKLKNKVKELLLQQSYDEIFLTYTQKTEYVAEVCAVHVDKLLEAGTITKEIHDTLFKKVLDVEAFDMMLTLGKIKHKDLPPEAQVTKTTEKVNIDYKKVK